MSAALDPAQMVSTYEIRADFEDLIKVAAWLEGLAEADGWPDRMRFGLDLSVEEALTNVISYGFEGIDHPPRIRLEYFRLDGGQVAVRIVDNGVAFNPITVGPPHVPTSIADARVGGHGVQLMRHFLADLSYERVADENRFTLVADPKKGP